MQVPETSSVDGLANRCGTFGERLFAGGAGASDAQPGNCFTYLGMEPASLAWNASFDIGHSYYVHRIDAETFSVPMRKSASSSQSPFFNIAAIAHHRIINLSLMLCVTCLICRAKGSTLILSFGFSHLYSECVSISPIFIRVH